MQESKTRRRTRAREFSVARRRRSDGAAADGGVPRGSRRAKHVQNSAGAPRRAYLSASASQSVVRNRQPTQLLEKSCFALIYVLFAPGSPRGPAGGLNVRWCGNTAVADRGFPEVFPARARHSGALVVLARAQRAILGLLPCF